MNPTENRPDPADATATAARSADELRHLAEQIPAADRVFADYIVTQLERTVAAVVSIGEAVEALNRLDDIANERIALLEERLRHAEAHLFRVDAVGQSLRAGR